MSRFDHVLFGSAVFTTAMTFKEAARDFGLGPELTHWEQNREAQSWSGASVSSLCPTAPHYHSRCVPSWFSGR